MKAPSPLLGFNNNFKHKGQVYHIQTEDSGVKHPHIITHLFADGGRILKSIKTSYASVIGDPGMPEIVRGMMKEQHKAMIVALRDGQFDPGGTREVKLPNTGPFAHAAQQGKGGHAKAADAQVAAAIVPTQSAKPQSVKPPPAEKRNSKPPPRQPHAAIDVQSDLPPPPATLLGGARPHGEYHHTTQAPQNARSKSQRPPPPGKSRSAPPPRPSQRPSSSPGRYAATRPASIFATSKPASGSIFGEDLISERSLDEVILSYLADDLEGEAKK
jgi:hypothetical protein